MMDRAEVYGLFYEMTERAIFHKARGVIDQV